jgi:hypothetical protein
MKMESHRKNCLKRQTELRQIMTSFDQYEKAIDLILHQHATLHSQKMAGTETWSFEDEVLDDMTEEGIRRIPQNCEHSVAWCIWHIARIEDVTMNMLVAGWSQLINQDSWFERMNADFRHTGNAMDEDEIRALSSTITIEALRAYRLAVGRRTQQIVQGLEPEVLKAKVDASRLQQVINEGAVVKAAQGIVDYWSKRDIAGLLLMPATRHSLVHLNEALKLKARRR